MLFRSTAFRRDYPATAFDLEARHFAGDPAEIIVGAGAGLVCRLTLNGRSCTDGWVSVQVQGHKTARTDEQGMCTLSALPAGVHSVSAGIGLPVEPRTTAHMSREITLVEGETAELLFDFPGGDSSLDVRFVGAEAPVGLLSLQVDSARGPVRHYAHLAHRARVTGAGAPLQTFEFMELPAGEARLTVSAGVQRVLHFPIGENEALHKDIHLSGGPAIYGQTRPLREGESAWAGVYQGELAPAQLDTPETAEPALCAAMPLSADGVFYVDALEPGVYTVAVRLRDPAGNTLELQTATADVGGENIQLHIPLGG